MAIQKYAEVSRSAGKGSRIIWICSDSQVALKALNNTVTNSSLLERNKASLAELGKNNKLYLTWIPGHVEWRENERAYALVKQSTMIYGPIAESVGMPFQEGCNRIDAYFNKFCVTAWREGAGCGKTKILWGNTGGRWSNGLLSLSRKLVTEHGNLRAFQYKVGK